MKKTLFYLIPVSAVFIAGYFFLLRNPVITKKQKEPYNVVLISIDTVRPDFMELYDPDGAPTPNLNRMAGHSFLFTNAISQVPFTLPSHCTMLTGTYPMKHGVAENTTSKLSEDSLTLAEVLKSNGYNTAGFAGSVVLEARTGIQQGFDTYDDSFNFHDLKTEDRSGIQKSADAVYDSYQRWLSEQGPEKFFAFVHFYDPHIPYDPPAPFSPKNRTPQESYKGELSYVDSVIGKLVEDLTRRGILDNTLVIITGDHGEMFGEHEESGHGYFIYQEALKVPLLIALPGQAGKANIDSTVQLVDLMPTILSLLEIPVPPAVQGNSFANAMQGRTPDSRAAFSESLTATKYFGAAPLRSLQDGTFKYIDSPRPELYDLNADSGEKNNLYAQKNDTASKMKSALNAIVKRHSEDKKGDDSTRKLSPEEAEQLASLGYIAFSNASASMDPTRDAKDFIRSWNDLNLLTSLLKEEKFTESLVVIQRLRGAGTFPPEAQIFEAQAYAGLQDHARSVSILEKVLASDPENIQARMAMAYSLKHTGQLEQATAIYKELMEKEDSVLALQNYARQMIRLGRKDEVLSYLNKMSADGKLSDRHAEVVGEIYLSLNQLNQARPYLMRAVKTNPDSYAAYINLSALMASEGRISEAVQLLENNSGRFKEADYLLQMGRLYGMAGNGQKEFETFQTMIQLHRQDPRGYFFLGKVLLEHHGDMQKVIQLAETGLSLNPSQEFQPFGYFLLGDAYTALGMPQKAKPYLEQAEKLRAGQ